MTRRAAYFKLWAPLAISVLALPAIYPLLTQGLTFSFDGQTHLQRLGALQRAVAGGLLLPRWLTEMQLGLGYPLFTFYSPGGYYVALLLALAGVSLDHAYALAMGLAVIIAGIGAWALGRDVHGAGRPPGAALLAGVTYSFSAYLLVNVYVRGSLPEALGQALLPWVVWSGRRLALRSQALEYLLLFAALLGGLMLCHSLLLALAVPYLLVYLAILWWNAGHGLRTLRNLALGFVAAAGISAFFWLPLLASRQYLTGAGYLSARLTWLPDNGWTWANFLDWHVFYEYVNVYPVQLSLVGSVLAVGGFVLARRRDAEWLFFGITALVCCVLIGSWSLAIWQSSDLLASIQFPWRLLALVSLSFAVLTGGWLYALRPGWPQWLATGLLILLVVATQRPQLETLNFYPQDGRRIDAPMLAANEVEKGVLTDNAASSVEEFRPRWTENGSNAACAYCLVNESSARPTLRDLQVGPLALNLQVSAPVTTSLQFQEYYFPGWQVTGPDGTALAPYPSGALGLLTVDLLPGDYQLAMRWDGPPLAALGGIVSLAILASLAVVSLAKRRYWLAIAPALCLALGLTGWLVTPSTAALHKPSTPLDRLGIHLLGYKIDQTGAGRWVLHPYWYISRQPPADLQMHLQLRAANGQIVQDYVQQPYFNQADTSGWGPGAIVDDALQVALPDGFAAGVYDLALDVEAASDRLTETGPALGPVIIGQVQAEHADTDTLAHRQPINADYGGVRLTGASYAIDGTWMSEDDAGPLLAKPGQYLTVRLYWQPSAAIGQKLHGFVHLVDAQGEVVAQRDQAPGPNSQPSTLWLPGITVVDEYRLRIPQDAGSVVVWPHVGLYDTQNMERRQVVDANGADLSDATQLAPIKIKSDIQVPVSQTAAVDYAGLAKLVGFDVASPDGQVRAGDLLTITLAFQSLQATKSDLTRFIHLYSPQLGMAAQADGVPQSGDNPTWSWVAGETIKDQVVLRVAPDAAPGRYRLLVGFYDKGRANARLAAASAAGDRLPDDSAILAQIDVLPSAAP